jgi:hypothetical protein
VINQAQLIQALLNDTYTLKLAISHISLRGVALCHTRSHDIIEWIVLAPWRADQGAHLLNADSSAGQWRYCFFCASHLTNQARAYLVEWCDRHEQAILRWCAGDESVSLPPFPRPAASNPTETQPLACTAS